MRRLQVFLLIVIVFNVQGQRAKSPINSAGVPPGDLLSMSTERLGQISAAGPMISSLPSAAAQAMVITCSYKPLRTGSAPRMLRHFWYREAPAWLSSAPAWHPIRKLVPLVAAECPATIADSGPAADHQSAPAVSPDKRVALRPAEASRSPQPRTETQLTTESFATNGLVHEKDLKSLYLGEFQTMSVNRDDTAFAALFEAYLNAFAQQCKESLPADSVEMTRQVCVTERYPVNRYGARIGPSTCAKYTQEGTGLYADPDLYAAKTKLDGIIAANALHEAFRYMASGNPMAAAENLLNQVQTSSADMKVLLTLNSCTSPALRRFQQNLMFFSLGRQAIRLSAPGGTSLSAIPPAPSTALAANNQDYAKLIEDLVSAQSKSWLFNRYVAGSISNVSVSGRDAAGHPTGLVAHYRFNGQSQGSLTVEFSDGLPECMYFFDLPAVCKAPDRRIVAAFENGSYQR